MNRTDNKSMSILGCGWLGLPLAVRLCDQGWHVRGSVTSPSKIDQLHQRGIKPFCLAFDPDLKKENNDIQDFFQSSILVVTVPFSRRLADPWFYLRQMEEIASYARQGAVDFVIVTGSTSVYPVVNAEVDEAMVINPANERAKVLLAMEQFWLEGEIDATIVRLAGLFGPDRPIGRFRAGHKNVPGASTPVNLIHQDDAVGLIDAIISQDARQEIFNGCSDAHPQRVALYQRAAERGGFDQPVFREEDEVSFKVVTNQKVKETLGYRFCHPDPMECV